MNAMTSMMSLGLRWKTGSLQKDRKGNAMPLRKAVWINKPLAEAEPALRTLVAGLHWDYAVEPSPDGRMTRFEVVDRQPDPEAKLPAELVLSTELRRIKALVEAGEAPTVDGQPHGQRSAIGRSAEDLFASIRRLPS